MHSAKQAELRMISVDRNSSALRAAKFALFADQRKLGNLLIAMAAIYRPWRRGVAKHPLDRLLGRHAVKRQRLVRCLAWIVWIVWWLSLINHAAHSTAQEKVRHNTLGIRRSLDGSLIVPTSIRSTSNMVQATHYKRAGFSLVELLAVVAFHGIIAAIIMRRR
jgi:hypothetical protein